MDELIVLLVRWIVRMIGDSSAQRGGTPNRGTPALPPAWKTAGPPDPAPVRKPIPTIRGTKRPPPLAKAVRGASPVRSTAGQAVATVMPRKPAAVAMARSGLAHVQSSLSADAIRRNWLMYEVLRPPVALREPERDETIEPPAK